MERRELSITRKEPGRQTDLALPFNLMPFCYVPLIPGPDLTTGRRVVPEQKRGDFPIGLEA
jgi:hypothetical protein